MTILRQFLKHGILKLVHNNPVFSTTSAWSTILQSQSIYYRKRLIVKYTLQYKGEELNEKLLTPSGYSIQKLEKIWPWFEEHAKELIQIQFRLDYMARIFPALPGFFKEGTSRVEHEFEWKEEDTTLIFAVQSGEEKPEDAIRDYEVRGVIVTPNEIRLLSYPDMDLSIKVWFTTETPEEQRKLLEPAQNLVLVHNLSDDPDRKNPGNPIKLLTQIIPRLIGISVLNPSNQCVGEIRVYNEEGKLKVDSWGTTDPVLELSSEVIPQINFDVINKEPFLELIDRAIWQ